MVNKFLMEAMNRLSPLIARRAVPAAVTLAVPVALPAIAVGTPPAVWLEDIKLFALGWVGGLVFFGTLIS
jgi:hypothetical protein